jgi:signal transduction histidine kinase
LIAWTADPKRKIQTSAFDSSDGVTTHAGVFNFGPRVAKTADGKLWISPTERVMVIDPDHLARNNLPPPVHIEQITADGKTYMPAPHGRVQLPARVRDLTIDYTGLSFAVPEKVHFRYKLDGQDRGWREVINDRRAQYTNLAPGPYLFRVIACNNSGVWNEQGDTLQFSVAPAYYQTNWFRALCAVFILALLWAAYQSRVRQLHREFALTLDARVGERTRIARELHDTLLQSVQGLLLQLEVVSQLQLDRPVEAKQRLDKTIERAAKAITEGRDAVQGLRESTTQSNDLARAVNSLGEQLAADPANQVTPAFRVTVEGEPRDLHPILRDEIYRISAEALRNSFRHAHARQIEVEIRYDDQQFRLRVRDDGKGIDPPVLAAHRRAGHYGLPGMRERAKLIGGNLALWSEVDGGTEVELTVPAATAYSGSGRGAWFSRTLAGKR